MEFKITAKYNEAYLEECLAQWNFSSKRAFSSLRTYFICSIGYLGFGLLNYLRGKSIPLFLSSFGLACFLLLIIQLLNVYQSKAKTKKNLLALIDKYKSNPTAERQFIFTEESIKYCDPEMLLELKWLAFSHYEGYGNYVLFFLNENKKPVLSIDKRNIPELIQKDLFELINSKITIEQ